MVGCCAWPVRASVRWNVDVVDSARRGRPFHSASQVGALTRWPRAVSVRALRSAVGADALGRRGPGAGLRQAETVAQARRWLRLFESLAVPQSARLLPQLGLRITDAPALRDTAAAVAHRLQTDLAQTGSRPSRAVLDGVNETLEDAYTDMEQRHGARLARAVFALSADGLPGRAEAELVATWDAALRDAQLHNLGGSTLDADKRDIVVSLIGHYLGAVHPLDAAAVRSMGWLTGLARWRRFASLCRALGRVLSDDELMQLVNARTAGDARLV